MILIVSMKRTIIFWGILILCTSKMDAIDPPSVVKTFYGGCQRLKTAKSSDEAYNIRLEMLKCFCEYAEGGNQIMVDDMTESKQATTYTMDLFNRIYIKKSLSVAYTITNTERLRQPDKNSNAEISDCPFYASYVTKTYSENGQKKTYKDVVHTMASSNEIVDIQKELDDNVNNKPIEKDDEPHSPAPPIENVQIKTLQARAAYYYTKGYYNLAYKTYEQIISQESTNGDAYYRLGLMTFWQKGCKYRFKNKKAARKVAKGYMLKATKYGNRAIKEKAENVYMNWFTNNTYF